MKLLLNPRLKLKSFAVLRIGNKFFLVNAMNEIDLILIVLAEIITIMVFETHK